MRFATIKGACGVVELVVEGEPMARSACAPLQSKERAVRRSLVNDEDELPLMQILTKLSQ